MRHNQLIINEVNILRREIALRHRSHPHPSLYFDDEIG